MKLALFGGADADYPRSRVLIEGLEALAVPCADLRVSRRLRLRPRWRELRRRFAALETRPEWLVVPEFAHKDLPLAWWLARAHGLRLAFDPLVSRHDMLVEDWRLYRPGSLDARFNRALDRWTLRRADLVACDTRAHAALFRELGARERALEVIPLGAERAYWAVGETPAPERPAPLTALYAGGFLPFHGAGVIVEAARRLAASGEAGIARFVLVGDGIDYERTARELDERPAPNVELLGRRPLAELPSWLERADLALGVFGAGDKRERVVPHKVVQALAAGRPVITARSVALHEDLRPGVDYHEVPPEDPEALAAAVRELARDAARRCALGRSGRAAAARRRTPEAVARAWLAALGKRA